MAEKGRVLVCGSRKWAIQPGEATVLHDRIARLPDDAVVIHGDCRGADKLAAYEAADRGLTVEAFPADWRVKPTTPPSRVRTRPDGTTYDAEAGMERNRQMLDTAPDLVLAFTADLRKSPGTRDTVNEARKRGIPVEVHSADDIVTFNPLPKGAQNDE